MPETLDKYILLEKLGQTEKVIVRRGQNTENELEVAVKIAYAVRNQALREDAIDDWRNEAGLIGKINHSGIVIPYDAFIMKKVQKKGGLRELLNPKRTAVRCIETDIEEGDTLCLVREYVHGLRLDDYMKKHKETDPNFEIHALDLMMQICDAIIYCHNNNIQHNDLTPRNILVTEESKIKVFDFGLAQYFNSKKTAIRGTPPYVPPELYQKGSISSPASEVYSLGALFYHMLSGEEIPPANERKQHKGRLQKDINQLEQRCNWSHDLWQITRKAIDMNPEKRYQSVELMKQELEYLKNKEYRRVSPLGAYVTNVFRSVLTVLFAKHTGQD